jgi:hypothetical protein
MRVLLGIILGAALVIGGAYLYDSRTIATTSNVERPMVNWDVVAKNWRQANNEMRRQFSRLSD